MKRSSTKTLPYNYSFSAPNTSANSIKIFTASALYRCNRIPQRFSGAIFLSASLCLTNKKNNAFLYFHKLQKKNII